MDLHIFASSPLSFCLTCTTMLFASNHSDIKKHFQLSRSDVLSIRRGVWVNWKMEPLGNTQTRPLPPQHSCVTLCLVTCYNTSSRSPILSQQSFTFFAEWNKAASQKSDLKHIFFTLSIPALSQYCFIGDVGYFEGIGRMWNFFHIKEY